MHLMPEIGQTPQQLSRHLGALAEQNHCIGILQSSSQGFDILDMVGPDSHIVICQYIETWQSTQGVKPIVKDMDFHFVFIVRKALVMLYTLGCASRSTCFSVRIQW